MVISLFVPFVSSNAAIYDVGAFYVTPEQPDGDYSIDSSGLFWDEFDFYARTYRYRDMVSMTFSGSHSGMYDNELMLINPDTRETYSLDENFSVTIDNLRYRERFAITGAGLNSSDSSILSFDNLSLDAELDSSPNPVTLPAAAWLFIFGLTGFATFRRKGSSLITA